jgi:DNA ligase (NAD+)
MELTDTHLYGIKENSLKRYIIKMKYIGNTSLGLLDSNFEETTSCWDSKKMLSTLKSLDDSYYNGISIVLDATYDRLVHLYESTYKIKYDKIGAPIKGVKVTLPIHMGSMDKVKPGSSELKNYFTKYTNPKCIMDKLDGTSLLLDLSETASPRAYTRGNGTEGQDISHKIRYINGLDNIDKWIGSGYIRGELIVPKQHWGTISHKGANARNYVSGIINRKVIDPTELGNITFVAYEWSGGQASAEQLSISSQLEYLHLGGFVTVKHKIFNVVTETDLPDILINFRNSSMYEIDGIIVQDDTYYVRNTTKNPKYAKAFKMDSMSESAITTVKQLIWTVAKDGGLRPVVEFEEVHLSGVKISKASAYNANYVEENHIGVGSQIRIIRSGDVIPKIIEVLTKSVPDWPTCTFKWDDNHTHILLENIHSCREVRIKQLEYFINIMGIAFFKKGLLTKAYDKGCVDIFDIVTLDYSKLMGYKIDGIKDKTALKIIKAIRDKLSTTTVGLFAASTPYFNGMASKRMVLLDMTIPTWITDTDDVLEENVIALDGFSSKTWNIIQKGRAEFHKLYTKCIDAGITFTSSTIQIDPVNEIIGEYTGRVFMFTGFRDSGLASLLKSKGGIIKESLTHKNGVTHLIIPSAGFSNTKVSKAMAMDVCIISKDDLL